MIRLNISHSVLAINTQKRYSPDITVDDLKSKLEMIVGTKPSDMILQLRNNNNEVITTLQPDTAQLKDFNLADLDNIHCVDINPDKGVVGMLDSLNKGTAQSTPTYKLDEKKISRKR